MSGGAVPIILKLSVERFRGLEKLDWRPSPGVNMILGGGDVGKTTILDAIALLLSPVNQPNLPDTDYFERSIDDGFSITAVLSLPPSAGINSQTKPAWPWVWDGKEAKPPALSDEKLEQEDAVYCVRVRATEDLELYYEILQPDGGTDSFHVALRRQIGLVRLGGDDRNDRDLRLVQGSALDRLLSDKGLRSRVASKLADHAIRDELAEEAKTSLQKLDEAFATQRLPTDLDLQITGGQGASIASMVGLTAKRDGVVLPVASWGSGTRRLAALAIAEQNQGETPITVVDEVERGLEPYRQHVLVEKLQALGTQVFITTHSPTAISAAPEAALWYIDHDGKIGAIAGTEVDRFRSRDPLLFLSRLAIICEGATEFGALTALLQRAVNGSLRPLGIHICDGEGHENALRLLEVLAKSGLRFGGFADEERKHPKRWEALHSSLGSLLFRWKNGCTEEEVLSATPDDKLEQLIADPEGQKTGRRLRSLAVRLGIEDKDFTAIRAAAGDGLRTLLLEAALGRIPAGLEVDAKAYKAHAQDWFKTRRGGYELGEKLFSLGLWSHFRLEMLPFLNAILQGVGHKALTDLPE